MILDEVSSLEIKGRERVRQDMIGNVFMSSRGWVCHAPEYIAV